jgi:hypothetical protein
VHKKKLIPQAILPVNPITIQDLPTELVELSDEAMSQVCGGNQFNYFIGGFIMLGGGANFPLEEPGNYFSLSNEIDNLERGLY